MIPSYYEFYNPVKILSGHKALENLPYELGQLGSKKPLIVTDKGIVKAGILKHVEGAFKESRISSLIIYDEVPPDSSVNVVNEIAQIYRKEKCDSIAAVGGGSVIDTAKGVCIVISEDTDDLLKLAGANIITKRTVPFVVIPTTAGTGSEVTSAAVIKDPAREIKLGFVSPFLLPDIAILDTRMTLTLPPYITAATAMDALTHAVESYICLQKNPLSDAYAWAAIKLITENLIDVIKNPKDKEKRLALANAACMAGVAFSNSMVGIVHSLGHATGAVAGVPHGVAMNIFLPHGLEYNFEKVETYLAELLFPLAGPEVYVKTSPGERAKKSIEVIRDLKNKLHELTGLPRTLEEAGVKEEKFPEIAEKAISDGTVILNPRELDYNDALTLLRRAYKTP